MQGLESYCNATKESWRGWAWNQIAARCCAAKCGGTLEEWRHKHKSNIRTVKLRASQLV